ncbi:efflux RND transporter permease subunit [Vibrio aestuarianus]|uniref:Copper/silver export system RND permease n=3 Tax=Vibrio aestuarianus TaxID=28171 RepID=A0ABN8TUB4_9VIBR|nr:efflux RND transporter permease subunit [Vibrio aestuarianus]MDE1215078.1 efflux RND transporter permease subunit [Vibrio aestuarianus]MDE1217842.1 efflux RND transporter permease subunit [Vibrio aestuarianus]MDE1226385.1 efflux RND transporter permease subunit [Vibrio aestuarianus]MDE1257579.1 efflux RND transporter permease subunit [Vibrio aestuarianus]MDE1262182.1 efflux RND transporter permease subunit [Vibrio aestuarianus]
MINSIIRWSLSNRLIVLLATVALVAAGLFSVKNTPVDAIPDLSDVQVIIKTSYPGQAPQVVEDQVTYPLTTAMLAVPGAETVRGYSFFGDSYVYIIFNDKTDMYWARSRVLEYLSQVAPKLPENAKPTLGPDATGVGWVFSYVLQDKSGQHDLAQLRSLQDWFLKYELQTVDGVSEVATVGGMVKQYQIQIDPAKLRAYNLTLQQVNMAIKNGNQETGASVIEVAEAEHMVRTTGYLTSIGDIQALPLKVTKEGTPLMLGDIADISVGPQMRRGISELNGEGEAVGGVIVMRFGENASKVISNVKTKLEELKLSLPEGVEIVPTYDRSTLINAAVDNLWKKLAEEFIVVAIVCALFLFHIRSSLVIALSLPVGILSAFIVMHWQGINANIMSLGGIAIAIGAMVDGAVVMIENVHKHIERTPLTDKNRWKVIGDAAQEVGAPLFFSLLIITLSFVPVFALEGQEGKMFSPLAFTKSYAMAASAGLSVTLVPVLMGYFIRGKILPEHKNPVNRILVGLYRPLLNISLNYPKSMIVIAITLMASAYYPTSKLGSEFIPPLDEGDLMYMPTTFPGISVGKARELLQQMDKLIKTVPEVKSVWGKVGRADTATDPAPLTMIETVIQLKPREEWREGVTTESLRKEFNTLLQFPGVTNALVMPIKTRIDMLSTGIKTPIGIKIVGPELKTIERIGSELEPILNGIRGTASVYAERVAGGRYVTLDIKRRSAARYGLSIKDIQQVVSTAVGGMNVGETIEGLERYPINVRYPQDYRDSVDKLQNLTLVTQNGARIALADVADVRYEDGPPVIKTENARPNGWVFVDIEDRDLGSYVSEAQKRVADELKIPAGYSLAWSGQYEYMERAKQRLSIVIPITLTIITLLLFFSFGRVGEVLIIMTTLPLAMVGGLWLMYVLNYNMSIAVGVGFIALSGVAVEIGVIMLVYLNQAWHFTKLKAQDKKVPLLPDDLNNAIREGAGLRVRPVMMTVVTVIIGLIPIMYGEGAGSQIMQRIAAPMIGGMASALLLTLLVIPAIFKLWKQHETK